MPNIHDAVTGEGAAPVVILDGSGTQITSFGSGAITSVVPGTAATNLGKAIDTAAGATDTGVALLGIRDDALSAITPAEGDWAPVRVDANGALYVQLAGALSASTDEVAVGGVTPAARVSLIDVDETEDEIKATAGTLHSFIITNLATSTRYVRFYNLTAANTTVGSSTIFYGPIAIPAGTGVALPVKIKFSVALSIAATTGVADSDTGAPGANEVVAAVVYS